MERKKILSIAQWSAVLASAMDKILDFGPEKREVVAYGLTVFLSNFIGLAVVFTVSWLLRVLSPTAAVVLALFILRPSAGGAHCTSSLRCNLLGFFILPCLGYAAFMLAEHAPQMNLYLQGIALLIVFPAIAVYAPYYTTVKPLVAAKKGFLKARALILAALLFAAAVLLYFRGNFLWSLGITMGLLWQGLMLLPPGRGAVVIFERAMDSFTKKGGES